MKMIKTHIFEINSLKSSREIMKIALYSVIKKHVMNMFFLQTCFFLRFFEKNFLTPDRSENVTIGKSAKNGSFKKNLPRYLVSELTYGQF